MVEYKKSNIANTQEILNFYKAIILNYRIVVNSLETTKLNKKLDA